MRSIAKKLSGTALGLRGVFALSIWCASNAVIAATVDFSGTWSLQERTSLTGTDYANGVPREIKIVVSGKEIVIDKTGLDAATGQDSTVSETLALDGSPKISTTPSKKERIAHIAWQQGKPEFAIVTRFSAPEKKDELEKTRTERWQLSKDGATLIYVREEKPAKPSNDPGENWSVRGEFALQRPGEVLGIRFAEPANLQAALALAKRENKYLFIDCYATWCGPCKEMDRSVYTVKKVGDYFNKHFVSIKIQMDKTPKDGEHVRQWYADADALGKEDVKAFPTYLFYSPDGQLVHKGMGMIRATEFIGLASNALSPNTQYYTLLKRYNSQQNLSVAELRALGHQERQFDRKEMAAKLAAAYLDKAQPRTFKVEDLQFLQGLSADPKARALAADYLKQTNDKTLLTKEHLSFIDSFWDDGMGSGHRLFKFFSRNAAAINELRGGGGGGMMMGSTAGWFTPSSGADWAGERIRRVILQEEITSKIYRDGKPLPQEPDWHAIEASLDKKYRDMDLDLMLLDAQIKFYYDAKQGAQYASYFARKVDKIGPLALSMADNTIASVMLGFCEDRDVLNKSIGWMETIIKDTEKKGQSPNGHMGNYAGLLYKAGRTGEAIKILEGMKEKGLLKGMSEDKLAILDRMKKGDKIDGTWNIQAFF